ncbi:MAG: ATP-binding cassette domain-containing protein [Eubacterium sp.]|nr:ATP-binding cassette domain-containing protein [Eubacterium sp.]
MSKRIAKVPVILQMETLECGAVCLGMILAYYKKYVPLEKLRVDCGVSRDGSNASSMVKAARKYDLKAAGFRMSFDELKNEEQFPCVVFWEYDHFLVVRGIKNGYVYINDPAEGSIKMPVERFKTGFTGIVLSFEPTEAFKPEGSKRSVVKYAARRMSGMKKAVVFVIMTTVLGYFFEIADPAMTRFFLDYILPVEHREWVDPFFIILISLAVMNIVMRWTRAIYQLKLDGKMAVMGSMRYMWHVFRLPMTFFSGRMAGDVIIRQEMNEEISGTIVNSVGPLFFDSVMMGIYLFLMMRSHFYLSLLGLSSILIHMLVAKIISQKRVDYTRVQLRDESRMESYMLNGIHMMDTIKSSGSEGGFFVKWSGYQASLYRNKTRLIKNDILLGIIPEFLELLAGDLVLAVGVWLIIKGHFAIGMIMAFQEVMELFLRPAANMIHAGQTIREMETQIERVEDVMKYAEDDRIHNKDKEYKLNKGKLLGDIELKGVSFGYSNQGKPVVEDLTIKVKQGQRIAIVGESGCGKSTLINLMTGLYRPWEGQILYDGYEIDDIDRYVFTGSVALVDQDVTLFADTIENNIKMWDDSVEDFEMILAARDAGIHDEIIMRDGGYRSMLLEGGSDLSGGERQRIEIARVLAKDPSVLILDEATSALDAKTEAEVVKAISDRGVTCIIIAHRLSTVRDCDMIYCMEDGRIVEQGTHDELFEKGGVYAGLVADE